MPDKRNLAYLRLSREDGDVAEGSAEESCSIASQRLCIQRYIKLHPELGGGFQELLDDGYSGTNFQRPGVAKLLELVEAGQVGTIIVRDLSRFARSYLEAGHFLEFVFPMFGVRFISINDGFDSASLGETTAGFQLAIRNLINQLYSRDISRKIKSAVDLKKLSGEYVYGAVPYGYRKGEKKHTIAVDPPAAATVRQIFEWAAGGLTVTQIAGRLNGAKAPTPSEYLKEIRGNYPIRPFWTFDSVKNILVNRIYTGDTVPFKSHVVKVGSSAVKRVPEDEQIILPNTHEAVVSRELFYQARKTIRTNRKSKAAKPPGLLSRYLVCGCCGNKLHKGRAKNYKCATGRYAPDSDCGLIYVQETRMEEIVLRAIRTQCEIVDAKIKRAKADAERVGDESGVLFKQLGACNNRLVQLEKHAVRLYEDYVLGVISKEAYLSAKQEEKEARAKAALEQMELERRLNERSAEKTTVAAAGAVQPLAASREAPELTPALLRELVQKVVVYPDRSIRIVWNFQDSLAV